MTASAIDACKLDANTHRRLYEMQYRQSNPDKFRAWSRKHYAKTKADICLKKALFRYSEGKSLKSSTMAKLVAAGLVEEGNPHANVAAKS
jgi:hypothetical protein